MGEEILQVPMWDFSMGEEIPQLPWWDFPMPSMGGGDSPIRQLEILHGWGDSPTARMGFLPPFYGGMWNLQLNRWRFSMGVEIPQLPNWDFSTPFMGMGNLQLSRWGILHGDSPIEKLGKLQIFNGCGDSPFELLGIHHGYFQVPEWYFSVPLMGGSGVSNWSVGDSPCPWSFPSMPEWDFSLLFMGVWGFLIQAVAQYPYSECGFSMPPSHLGGDTMQW
ncbi:hypothetical protein BKA83DRAFT_4123624 [Pisolithus microcarpus]|nr:hypothetical protein BKA83DRAFT_4123624 [Pisolithus microcarpus]